MLNFRFCLLSGQHNLAVPGAAHVSRTPSTTITTRSTVRSPRASPSPSRANSVNRAPRSPSRGRPTETRKVSQRNPSSQRPYTGQVPSIKTEELESEDTMPPKLRTQASRDKPSLPGRFPLNRSMSADPNLNDPKIQAKIGNRQIKTVNKTIGEFLYNRYHWIKVLEKISYTFRKLYVKTFILQEIVAFVTKL